jgi:tetratricopeptide (TPR) repeat protein
MSRHKKKRKPSQQQLKRRAAKKLQRPAHQEELESELVVSEYEITDEPVRTPAYQKLPAQVREQIEELHEMVSGDPHRAVPLLEGLLEKYPGVPLLYNYLAGAYGSLGEVEKARAVSVRNYEQNPDYLFAKCNYAEFCLREGKLEKIPEIFAGKFDLKMLYPHRKTFHVTEVVGFGHVMGTYFYKRGEKEAAKMWYRLLAEIAPEHPHTRQLKALLAPSLLGRVLKRMV